MFFRADLGLVERVRLKWMVPCNPEVPGAFHMPGPDCGFTPIHPKNQIWIPAVLKTPALECVIAHELKHVHQNLARPKYVADPWEKDADAYAFQYGAATRALAAAGRLTDQLRAQIETVERKIMTNIASEREKRAGRSRPC